MPRSCTWSLSLRFPHQNPVCTAVHIHTCHKTRLSYSYWFARPRGTWWWIQILKPLIMQFPLSRSFWGLRLKGEFWVEFILPFLWAPRSNWLWPLGWSVTRRFVLCYMPETQSVASSFLSSGLGRRQSSLCFRLWLAGRRLGIITGQISKSGARTPPRE